MASYAGSTQRRLWTFTHTELTRLRAARHAAAVSLVERSGAGGASGRGASGGGDDGPAVPAGTKRPRPHDFAADDAPEQEGGGSVPASAHPPSAAAAYLSLDEEEVLLSWARVETLRLCRAAGFDRAVTSSAVAYVHRYYVHGALVHYPPHELITPSIFLAIKTEACPYSEFEPLSRRLARLDADLRTRVYALMDAHGVTAVEEAAAASAAPPSVEDPLPWHLSHEAPLLSGLHYHLLVHAPYRPLKALLLDCVEDYAALAVEGGGAGGRASTPFAPGAGGDTTRTRLTVLPPPAVAARGYTFVSPEQDAFAHAWDAIQARAFEFVDAALLSDAPLLYSPAHVALACLLLAGRGEATFDTPPLTPAPGSEGWGASGGGGGTGAARPASEVRVLLPALATPPPPHVAWWVEPWVRATLAAGGGGSTSSPQAAVDACLATVVAFLRGLGDVAAAGPRLLATLEGVRDGSLVAGTAGHASRTGRLRVEREAYKQGKEARGVAARQAFEANVRVDRAALGVELVVLKT